MAAQADHAVDFGELYNTPLAALLLEVPVRWFQQELGSCQVVSTGIGVLSGGFNRNWGKGGARPELRCQTWKTVVLPALSSRLAACTQAHTLTVETSGQRSPPLRQPEPPPPADITCGLEPTRDCSEPWAAIEGGRGRGHCDAAAIKGCWRECTTKG